MIGLTIKVTEKSTGTELILQKNAKNVGIANITKTANMTILNWIEIKNDYQRQGMGTYLLNHIVEKYLSENSILKINVVDENILEFYFNFLKKKGLNTRTINNYVIDDGHHPEIIIPAELINPAIRKRPKIK